MNPFLIRDASRTKGDAPWGRNGFSLLWAATPASREWRLPLASAPQPRLTTLGGSWRSIDAAPVGHWLHAGPLTADLTFYPGSNVQLVVFPNRKPEVDQRLLRPIKVLPTGTVQTSNGGPIIPYPCFMPVFLLSQFVVLIG